MAFDDDKVCAGCPDAADGCRLECLKFKSVGSLTQRPIAEIVGEARELFAKYEITAWEMARTEELARKLDNSRITVSVIGQFKRGKSTLVNAVLGEKILPVGIVPVTAAVTIVKHGERSASVYFDNGVTKEIAFEEMSSYINEQENSDNHLGVSKVEVSVPSPFLSGGMTLVDTPGVGSVHKKNSETAYSYVRESDAVIFMLSVDSPINQIEIDFLENAAVYASKFYFAVNKIDSVDTEDLEEYLKYCRELLKKLMGASCVQLFPVSARKGEGIGELKAAVESDCRNQATEIVEASAKLKMRDIVASALSQIRLYRAALGMPADVFDTKFKELNACFAEVTAEAEHFADKMGGNRLMFDAKLNELKNRLSAKVSDIFGIEYHYELDIVDFSRGEATDDVKECARKCADEEMRERRANDDGRRELGMEENSHGSSAERLSVNFVQAAKDLCDELGETLNTIFMHREENAYTVCRRINDLNRLVRRLMSLRRELSE